MEHPKKQYLEWGETEWIYEPRTENIISVGIGRLFPGKVMEEHLHIGDDQLLYILSGRGKQYVNDTVTYLIPQNTYVLKAGITHKIVNCSPEVFEYIIVSIPEEVRSDSISDFVDAAEDISIDKLLRPGEEMDLIFERLGSSYQMPVTVFDLEENVVVRGRNFPKFCVEKCAFQTDPYACEVYAKQCRCDRKYDHGFCLSVCRYGYTVFSVPVRFEDREIGKIQGGPVGSGGDLPDSRVNAIFYNLEKLSKNIVDYLILQKNNLELQKNKALTSSLSRSNTALERTLKFSQDFYLSSRINTHFLFNTLNSIGSLALRENAGQTYGAILNLANLLRHNLKVNTKFVKLSEEISSVKNYLDLEMLKLEEIPCFHIDIQPEARESFVPFNCLQPIVENVFIHGYSNRPDLPVMLSLCARKWGNYVKITVRDRGRGVSPEKLNELRSLMDHYKTDHHLLDINYSSGLMMICSKLSLYYGKDFQFDIDSAPGSGTTVSMSLPVRSSAE